MVIDFHGIDQRLQIGLAERHRPAGKFLAHGPAELLDQRRIDDDRGDRLLLGTIERRLGPVTICFERLEPVLEDGIDLREAVLDQPIEPFELVFCVGDFPLQRNQSAVEAFRLFGAPCREG
ncbi:hypothetical protein [Rhodoplanes sp.]|uniref:hypothetical protein n=1 Tax=Rhodoplanes sp. TaxID=1968906 RepID=UPI0025DAADDE|nr:hypothetical protein [Rhodoplanes sp.]